MIIAMKPGAPENEILKVEAILHDDGVQSERIEGTDMVVIGAIGNTRALDPKAFLGNRWVKKVTRIQEPYKRVSRNYHEADSIVNVSGVDIGGDRFTVIAGPCSVETDEEMAVVSHAVKEAGASLLRGGAFKPRTSPYSFQGLGIKGLDMLKAAGAKEGLPIVTEIISPDQVELFDEKVDLIQVGARNMQNFALLKELGQCRTPVLLKRGMAATIEEWLLAAEYILAGGNKNVIFCERGIRTYESYTRNTLDLSAVAAVKRLSHLPVIVDPSHAAGRWDLVEPLSLAAAAVGADGLIVEVHNDPDHALSDGAQSLKPDTFAAMMTHLEPVVRAMGKRL